MSCVSDYKQWVFESCTSNKSELLCISIVCDWHSGVESDHYSFYYCTERSINSSLLVLFLLLILSYNFTLVIFLITIYFIIIAILDIRLLCILKFWSEVLTYLFFDEPPPMDIKQISLQDLQKGQTSNQSKHDPG